MQLFAELLPDTERVLGDDHADTLWIRDSIAWWTGQIGDVRERCGSPTSCCRTNSCCWVATIPPRSARARNIAHWCGRAGETQRGVAAVYRAPAGPGTSAGRDHPATLTTRNRIADWTSAAGETREALCLRAQLLPDQERVLGRDHADTLDTRYDIASCTGEVGESREALRLLADLLADQDRLFGSNDLRTLRTRLSIASCTGEVGDDARGVADVARSAAGL